LRASAPASSANLGPGYDVLALALSLRVEVDVAPAERLSITSLGEGADLPRDAGHLAARVVNDVLGHSDVEIRLSSEVPVARGLGSSAAVALATAAAAGSADPLAVAVRLEGHADNAAAAMLGGLVAASVVGGSVVARRLPLDDDLVFVAVVPDQELATEGARALVPREVPMADAVHNLGRMGLLLAGLAERSALVPAAGEDRLHQERRTALFPEAPVILRRLEEAGAALAVWSGAGPSMLAACRDPSVADEVRRAGEAALAEQSLAGKALVVSPSKDGLIVG
jgi:homoserine kinase